MDDCTPHGFLIVTGISESQDESMLAHWQPKNKPIWLAAVDLNASIKICDDTNADPTLTVFHDPQELDKPDGE